MFIQEIKKIKIFETWFVHKEVNFEEMKYDEWKKKFYSGDKFKL